MSTRAEARTSMAALWPSETEAVSGSNKVYTICSENVRKNTSAIRPSDFIGTKVLASIATRQAASSEAAMTRSAR